MPTTEDLENHPFSPEETARQARKSVPCPVFTIKACDALAVPVLRAYKEQCEDHGLMNQAESLVDSILEFRQWQNDHTELTKLPDHPHQPFNPEANE